MFDLLYVNYAKKVHMRILFLSLQPNESLNSTSNFYSQITVESRYPSNPFHNFRHCFCVAQMMFAVLCGCPKLTGSGGALSKMDQAVLITAAVCHDLDHPGNSNS